MPWLLYPQGKGPWYTHWIGSWVGPRAVLDVVVKRNIPSSCQELNPRTLNIPVKSENNLIPKLFLSLQKHYFLIVTANHDSHQVIRFERPNNYEIKINFCCLLSKFTTYVMFQTVAVSIFFL
jgi:hypothetical protein